MIPFTEIYVVEFSLSQKAFHIDTLDVSIKNNQTNMALRTQNDYQIIGAFNTYEQASYFISQIRDKVKDYCLYKSTRGDTLISD